MTPGRRTPSSFDQEVVDFPTQLDEDLKDYKDKGKAATPCSDQELVDFLAQLDTRTPGATRTRRRPEPPTATGARPPPAVAPPRPGLSPNNATATAAAGSQASRPSHLPSTVPCPAMTRPTR